LSSSRSGWPGSAPRGPVFHDVTSLRFAEKAIAAGADGLTCIGAGGGGHSGTVSHLALIPKVRAIFDGTIVLAGAVSTGAAIRAAELLGADLAYLGTRFIATQESLAAPTYKELLVSQSSEEDRSDDRGRTDEEHDMTRAPGADAAKPEAGRPATPVPAGTVIVLRDGAAGLEVLMLRRATTLAFAAGNWVFPGGRVEPADLAAAPPGPGGYLGEQAAARRAAAREAAEEAGIALDPASLVPLSHWLPPATAPRRFSTWIFLASAVFRPRMATVDGTTVSVYAEDAGYHDAADAGDGPRHRLILDPAGWRYERTFGSSPRLPLSGRVAVVTGAGRGIGAVHAAAGFVREYELRRSPGTELVTRARRTRSRSCGADPAVRR
jgi:8-oxo-dGTP pyrophosphatase MutT (NUDIX family)